MDSSCPYNAARSKRANVTLKPPLLNAPLASGNSSSPLFIASLACGKEEEEEEKKNLPSPSPLAS
jgi:hypothetical protein